MFNPWNLDALIEVEKETGRNVFVVHQLCYHPEIIKLREKVLNGQQDKVYNVELTYITPRGKWYQFSWKGDEQKSGGIVTNISIHLFDLLISLFGEVLSFQIEKSTPVSIVGSLTQDNAKVKWHLSIDRNDLKTENSNAESFNDIRTIFIDNDVIELGDLTVESLHTKSYTSILAGKGIGLKEVMPSISLVSRIQHSVQLKKNSWV